jgi:hypothetical protein
LLKNVGLMRAGKSQPASLRLATLASTGRDLLPSVFIVLIYYICFSDLALLAADQRRYFD